MKNRSIFAGKLIFASLPTNKGSQTIKKTFHKTPGAPAENIVTSLTKNCSHFLERESCHFYLVHIVQKIVRSPVVIIMKMTNVVVIAAAKRAVLTLVDREKFGLKKK